MLSAPLQNNSNYSVYISLTIILILFLSDVNSNSQIYSKTNNYSRTLIKIELLVLFRNLNPWLNAALTKATSSGELP